MNDPYGFLGGGTGELSFGRKEWFPRIIPVLSRQRGCGDEILGQIVKQ